MVLLKYKAGKLRRSQKSKGRQRKLQGTNVAVPLKLYVSLSACVLGRLTSEKDGDIAETNGEEANLYSVHKPNVGRWTGLNGGLSA
jgi:hypothetical protein